MEKNIIRMNDFRMFKRTQETLTLNAIIVNTMPGLASGCTQFYGIVSSIEIKNKAIERTTTGVTKSKEAARNAMVNKAQEIGNRAMAYASTDNDRNVYATMSELLKRLTVANDNLCFTRCNNVADVAEKVLPLLINWNVLQSDIDELRACCITFRGLQTTASVIEGQVNTAIKEANNLFKEGKLLLQRTIDKAVKSLKSTQFAFYTEYFNARRVQNLGHRYTQFKGVAVSGLTKDEIRNVEIQFRTKTETFVSSTDDQGKYNERLTPDVYDIIVTHPQYESFIIEGMPIQAGEIIVENFELKPKA